MATTQLNQSNNFRQNITATTNTITFLVNGATCDVLVYTMPDLTYVGGQQNVAPGNIAKVSGIAAGSKYQVQANNKGDPKLANVTVTYWRELPFLSCGSGLSERSNAEMSLIMNMARPGDGTPYSLKMVNGSSLPWVFFVYQKLPNQPNDIFSLAWLASPYKIVPGGYITFTWSIDYTFVWGQTAQLIPGVVFTAGQSVPADPNGNNLTTFSGGDEPQLSAAIAGGPSGSLTINDDSTVPVSGFSVGIGMGDTGTFVTLAGPNLTHQFTPTPSYFVAAGSDQQIGTVLDIKTVTQTAEAKYGVNIYSITATLGSDNQWSFQWWLAA
jgi:hypothetical protein